MESNTKSNIILPQVLGVTGHKYNGKDTLGNYFVEKYGYKRLAFADSLKDGCREIFGFSDEQLYGNKKEIIDEYWGVTPRTVLQYVGTDLFREQLGNIIPKIGKNIWLKVVEKKILDELKLNPNARFVVTDVRFPNECQMIKDLGGIVIRVKRDCVNNVADFHISELEIEKLDVNIELQNNGSKDELFELAINALTIDNSLTNNATETTESINLLN